MVEKYISKKYKDSIKGIYKEECYLEDTGLPFEKIKQYVFDYYANNKASQNAVQIRMHLFKYILDNAQLDIRDDYFADRINHYPGPASSGSLLTDIRRFYEAENDSRLTTWEDFRDMWDSNLASGGSDLGHTVPCWDNLYRIGLVGVLKQAKHLKKINPGHGEFYDSVISAYDAMINLAKRMAVEARKINGAKSIKLAEALENISVGAPKTLHDVLELNLLFFSIQVSVECDYIRSYDHSDEFLKPFYEKDIANGVKEEELDELLAAYFLRLSEVPLYANSPICIGGHDENGNSNFTYFTEKLIDIYSTLDIYSPKIQIIYSNEMPKSLAIKICNLIKDGASSFVFINERAAIDAFLKLGYDEKDARRVYIIGCYEPIAFGTELCSSCNGNISLPKCLQLVMDNGYDYLFKKETGIKTGELCNYQSFDALVNSLLIQIKDACHKSMKYITYFEENYMFFTSAPLLSGSYPIALEKGMDIRDGGMKYNTSGINLIGLATVVDSLSCIKHFVFDEKRITLMQLNDILHNDWKGHEILQKEFKEYRVKYGNNIQEIDDLAQRIYNFACDIINGKPNGRKGFFKAGTFSVNNYMDFKNYLGASADGRNAKDFISKNLEQSVGCDFKGITAIINSVAKLDASKNGDGTVLDFVVHPSLVNGNNGGEILYYLIKTFMTSGGFAIHGNVFDYKALEEAQKNPENFQNLQVRVCGWNAYFVNLKKEEQDIFIKNAKHQYENSNN